LALPDEAATKRILVVDADPAAGALLERALGYKVAQAAHCEEAAALARGNPFDAALVAHDAAPRGGADFLRWLAHFQPGCLRLLLCDAVDGEALIGALNRGEIVRVIRRPLDPVETLAALQDTFASARRMETVTTERMIESHRQERRWFDETVTGDLLRLALQPIVLFDGEVPRIVAYEALLRPQHPAWDLPVPVLVVAERLARVHDLGARVFGLAAAILPRIPAPLGLFVNLHPLQLAEPETLLRHLAPLIPHARRITLEITERAHPLAVDGWEAIVDRLVELGFALAIDDLGAGSAGLVLLASLQPNVIKLDMSLIRGIEGSSRKRRLIQLLVTFADTTGATLLAEGVESADEVAALRGCGVRMMQGYLFGRPTLETAA
jgi:EAL domain-containing protein (putative c-di-GMP-specific phosphodiesterase class I)/CheY-like chemotaxis protein